MADFSDHAAHRWCVFQRALTVFLVETKTDQRLTLATIAPQRAADLFDRDRLAACLIGHNTQFPLAPRGAPIGIRLRQQQAQPRWPAPLPHSHYRDGVH